MNATVEVVLTNLSIGEKITFGIIAALGIVGNSLVVYVLTHMVKSRKGNVNILIINQSLVDLATSVLLILCFLTPEPPLPSSPTAARFLCSVWNSKYLFWATIISSTFNLVCLTLERYFAIVYPFKYRSCTLFTWPKSLVLAIVPVLVGYSYQAYFPAMHVVEDGKCVVNEFSSRAAQIVYAVIILLVTYLLPLGVMTFAYIRIYKALRTESIGNITGESCQSMNAMGNQRHNPNDINEKALRNIVKTLILVYVVFGLCWAPNEVFYFYFNVSGNQHINETVYNITICLAFFNMCANPFIYAFKYRRFREGLQRAMPRLGRLLCVTDTSLLQEENSPQLSTSVV
ncbi:galanin receptor 2b-like [Patiria miniata]|uniref:G-protein coupled receptors family 1 profile domain-containing protein n=1 Tax=Patiria miniata TaxID=46514 RepID=A0A913Z8Q6_PATMI|nr:galanin receptor 2b-like [Patiria miniata]